MKISLRRREVESLDLLPNDRIRLTTRNGTAWITLSGVADDFALTSFSPVELTGPGRLVIEALDENMVVHADVSHPLAKNESLATAS